MGETNYYRDDNIPFFEMKFCTFNLHPEKKHAHDEYSIAFIEKGASKLDYANESVIISEGQVILIASDIMHYCQPIDPMNWSYQMIYISKSWFEALLKERVLPYKLLIKNLEAEGILKLQDAFNLLKSPINTLKKEEVLTNLIKYLYSVESFFVFSKEAISNNEKACEKIKKYIYENFLRKISLEDLGQLSGLSSYYIIKLFKQKYDITPHAYQISCRMNHAKKEMTKGRDIATIAHEIGCYDQSHFSKTFKAYFGVTPQFYLD